uniref:Uncharacterized protein n=1 Tax=Physcomitrium patens TaxID=3218 RepID=A0A2K1JX83_PHYPA|nr:hypothetical protein PHYPA_013264 [Physcomitrium patens]
MRHAGHACSTAEMGSRGGGEERVVESVSERDGGNDTLSSPCWVSTIAGRHTHCSSAACKC